MRHLIYKKICMGEGLPPHFFYEVFKYKSDEVPPL